MVIKASAAAEIRHLIEALGAEDDVRREAAVARLSVLGARAVDRLVAAYDSAPTREMKVAVLRALEVAGDRRIVAVSKAAIQEGGDVAIAAVAALAAQIESTHAATAAEVLDVLVAAALDPAKEKRVRVTAYQAIQHIPQVGDRIADRTSERSGRGAEGSGTRRTPRQGSDGRNLAGRARRPAPRRTWPASRGCADESAHGAARRAAEDD